MDQRKSPHHERTRALWISLVVACFAAMLVYTCKPTPPVYVTPDVCLDEIHVRALFGRAALESLRKGRFDPFVYRVSAGDILDPDPDVAPAPGDPLREALRHIDENEAARVAFRANVRAAQAACDAPACSRQRIEVTLNRAPGFGDAEVYNWVVTGEPPPEALLRVFQQTHAYQAPGATDCKSPPAVDSARRRVNAAGGNCRTEWDPPSAGGGCRPPRGGEWEVQGELLCCAKPDD